MEEELEKVLSIIRDPGSRVLNLSKFLTHRELESHDIAAISMEIRLKGKKFESIVVMDVDLSALNEDDFISILNIIELCSPMRLYFNNVNLKNLSVDRLRILSDSIIPLGIKLVDISNNDLYGFEQEKFTELCRMFKKIKGLTSIYIACSNFMHTTEENQIELWRSIATSTSVEEVYIWQSDRTPFTRRVKDTILDTMDGNFRIKFVGLYSFHRDREFMEVLEGYVQRNSRLADWVSKNMNLGNFLLPSPVVDTDRHAQNTVVDWAAILNFDGKKLYTWHNGLYKMFIKVANSISSSHLSMGDVLRKTHQYAVNNWAKTIEGKNLVSRSFEMNLRSIKKALVAPVRLYSYESHCHSEDAASVEDALRLRRGLRADLTRIV